MEPLESLQAEIARTAAPPEGVTVVVAVSGGADSTALLRALSGLAPARRWALHVAHLDHGLRGEAGAADRAFVEGLARDLGLPVRADHRPVERSPGESPEEAAREVRRAFLRETARDVGAEVIALGHTADDLAETILLRLVRGTGPGGLAAMTVRDGPWWRPLLRTRGDALRDALRKADQPWREDETNDDRRFDRNRVRHELMPLLRELNPRVVDALGRTASLAALDESVLDDLARDAYAELAAPSRRGGVGLDSEALGDLAPAVALRVVRRALREVAGTLRGLGLRHVEAVHDLAAARTGRAVELPGGATARAERGRVVLRPPAGIVPAPADIAIPGEVPWERGRVTVRVLSGDDVPADPSSVCGPRRALIDPGRADALTVRAWQEGDRFRPLGGPGERLVADFLRDAGVPAPDRRHLPLVLAEGRIAWIGGHRIDERFRLPPGAERAVELVWEES